MHSVRVLAVLVLLAPGTAFAQFVGEGPRPILLPGSVNMSVGTLAPAERDNVLGQVNAEQGFTIARWGSLFVVGFADVGLRHDSEALSWNRATTTMTGFKVGLVSRAGVLQLATGLMSHDLGRGGARVRNAAYVSYWTGWRGDMIATDAALLPDALPGYAYAASGLLTAAEPDNWITSIALQQGATVFRGHGVSVVPYVGASANADTARYSWNNRARADAGIKLTREVASGVVEAGIAHRREQDLMTGESRTAPVVYINLWFGWNPRIGRR